MISGNYRELKTREEIDEAVSKYGDAWKSDLIPQRQFDLAVRPEIQKYREGAGCPPFDALVRCLLRLPGDYDAPERKLLDVGASSAYYSEVLKIAGFKYHYTGTDFSPAFKELALKLYPGISFDVADARELPYPDDSFDVVVSGCCIIHTPEYERVISETARVAKRYAVFHRTPVLLNRPTTYYVKEAYGLPCVEIHFSEQELFHLFQKYGLFCTFMTDVFLDKDQMFAHREYLLEKV